MRIQQNPFQKIKSDAGNYNADRSICQVTAVIYNVGMIPILSTSGDEIPQGLSSDSAIVSILYLKGFWTSGI